MARPVLSLVIPVRDEESGLPDVHARVVGLLGKIGQEAEVVFVNDGSMDLTHQVLRGIAAADARFRVLSLSRPFGPAAAVAAGLAYARGQAVVAIPPDLLERADMVLEMAQKWREGYEVVHARARVKKGGLSGLVRRFAQSMLPADVPLEHGGARLMSRRAVVALRTIGESNRFVRGVVAWVGFKQTELEYDGDGLPPRLGATWRTAWSALTAYSTVPLRLATYFGLILGTFAFFLGIVSTIVVATGSLLPGWLAGAIIGALFTSAQLVAIGILGDYVGKVYDEVKRRPLYVVSDRVNLVMPDDDIVEEAALPFPPLDAKAPPFEGRLTPLDAKPAPPEAMFPPLETKLPPLEAKLPPIEPKASAPAGPTVVGMPALSFPSTTAPMPIPKTAPMAQVPAPPGFPSPTPPPGVPQAPGSNPVPGRGSGSVKAASAGAAKPTQVIAAISHPNAEPLTIREDLTPEPTIPAVPAVHRPPPPMRSSTPPTGAPRKPPPVPTRVKKEE